MAVIGEGFHSGGAQRLLPVAAHKLGNVPEKSGSGLIVEHAATPTVEQVRALIGLQQGRQGGFEGLVFQEFPFNLDAGVLLLELGADLLP